MEVSNVQNSQQPDQNRMLDFEHQYYDTANLI